VLCFEKPKVIDIGEIMYLWSEQRVFQFVRKIDKKGADVWYFSSFFFESFLARGCGE
jgi:hypothetical protein